MTVRKFGDFKYGFSKNNIEKLKMAGITPSDVQGIIRAGRSRGISDEGIWQAINNQYKSFAEKYNAEQQANKEKFNKGAIYYTAEQVPVIGTYVDELGAYLTSDDKKSYQETHKKIEEARKYAETQFKEGAKSGNWLSRNVWRYAPEAMNVLLNSGLAVATGGKTLMPVASGVQGAIEGFGRGDDLGERLANSALGGTISYAIPSVMNKILPTKTVQKRTVDKLAKKPMESTENIIARAIKQGTTAEDIVAKQVPRGMRKELFGNIRRASTGENIYRKTIQSSVNRVYNNPYDEYVTKEISGVAPSYAKQIGDAIEKLKLSEMGDDVIAQIDNRKVVLDAVNKVMRGASDEAKEKVATATGDAIARWSVAKALSGATVKRPISTNSGSLWSLGRRMSAPLRDAWHYGTMRTMTTGTPNFIPGNRIERLSDFLTPDYIRGALDASIEKQQLGTIK